jgi:flavin reductase (DIM6/NTAB) family NADH-FMN oxidoreductase RutF
MDRATTSETLQKEFRKAWSRFATGVTLITTTEPDGAVHAMTANGVTSVSLSPPLALVSIGHERNTHRLIRANGKFGISILGASQAAAAAYYAQPPERRDAATRFQFQDLGGARVLVGALAAMRCRVVAEHEAGDHTIFVAEAEKLEVRDGKPLLWFAGAFGDFALRAAAATQSGPDRR